jgi:surface polysaccharide O-acyltransferase-like enzyme
MDATVGAWGTNRTTTKAGEAESLSVGRLHFFDTVRSIAMLSVILYHAVAAYSTVTPHWSVHDGTSIVADGIRHLFDVFMMPVFFFVAGYFALSTIERQGPWDFLKGKCRRIGIPWLVAIFIVVPMVRYAGEMKGGIVTFVPFWRYWLGYSISAGHFLFGPASADTMSQMHFWFLSLLLAFFVILAAARLLPVTRKARAAVRQAASTKSIYVTLVRTASLTTLAYFVLVSVIPEASWMNINLLLQFQPASLVVNGACFVLGVVAARAMWFTHDAFPGTPLLWGLVSVAFAGLLLVIGKGVFAAPLTADELPAGVLLAFALVRTLLCLSVLVLIVAYARKRRSRTHALGTKLAASSYNIYLCHLFFVVFLQDVLIAWQGGAPMAKATIVFLAALPISYGVARAMDRFPKGFVFGLGAVFLLVTVLCR